jgi:hypothetical protein
VNGHDSFKPLKSPKKEEFGQSLKNSHPKSETSEAANRAAVVVSESVAAEEKVRQSKTFNQISDDHAEQPNGQKTKKD